MSFDATDTRGFTARHLLLALAAVTVSASALPAQTFPTDDATIRRIYTMGMDSSQVMRFSQVFFDSVGPRLTGTALQRNASDWVMRHYKSWGIDARTEKVGTWRNWRRGHTHIDLMTPRVRTLEGTLLGWSPGTGKKDVTAGTIILPRFADSTEFVKWLPQAKGKFVLLSPAMPTCRPTENWATHATPESKARMDSLKASVRSEWAERVRATGHSLALGTGSLGVRMEKAGVAGMITSRPKDAWGTMEVFETYNTTAPALGLSCEDYGLVYRLTENRQGPTIRLNADAELLGEQPIYNTIGMIRGTEKPDEYVLLSAHFDSFDGGSGATDNGTGTMMMFEAMRILSQAYPKPKRTILVGHWTAEEQGLVGSRAFSEDHPEVREGLHALFNQDNGTGRIQSIGAGGLANSGDQLKSWMAAVPTEMSSKVTLRIPGNPSGGGSDDASFACWGLPAFGLGGTGWDYGNYTWHTNRDTFDKIVFDDIRFNATLVAMLAYMASESPTKVDRTRASDEALMAGRGGGRGGNAPTSFAWPSCQKAPRVTNPRLR
jgi:carboxypeptidase Q